MTACGNFVVIGYDTGHLDRFNIQSGLARGSYGDPGKVARAAARWGLSVPMCVLGRVGGSLRSVNGLSAGIHVRW